MSNGHSKESIQEHIRVYLMVFGALAVLTVITVLASFIEVSTSEGIFLALIIASVKASLVAGYFMHLITEKGMIISILLLTVFFLFIMIFLPLISYTDSDVKFWKEAAEKHYRERLKADAPSTKPTTEEEEIPF